MNYVSYESWNNIWLIDETNFDIPSVKIGENEIPKNHPAMFFKDQFVIFFCNGIIVIRVYVTLIKITIESKLKYGILNVLPYELES